MKKMSGLNKQTKAVIAIEIAAAIIWISIHIILNNIK
jgi:hypothetical protein